MTRLGFLALLGVVASIVAGATLGALIYRSGLQGGAESRLTEAVAEVAGHIHAHYVEEVPEDQLVNDALDGMVRGLDEHSRLFDREEYKLWESNTWGEVDGKGAASVTARWLAPGYAYAHIEHFRRRTGDEFVDALQSLRRQGEVDGLVLDLRNNLGGILGTALDVADALLRPGKIICTESRPGGEGLVHRAMLDDLLQGAPVVVLINERSASGSEIVASALQDQQRATVIGEQSYGKGSVQSVLPLSGGLGLKLTTGYYFRPNGEVIHETGVVPDEVVAADDEEATLARALQILKAASGTV